MNSKLKKSLLVFSISFVIILILFFMFPINLFDGEIIVKKGLVEEKIQRPLSLSYFIGMGYDSKDMDIIKDFYLLPKGYLTAFLLIFCFPALLSYRIFLGKKEK